MPRGTPAAQGPITVEYSLFDLPTAQHKAGLAGLLLQIEHMEKRDQKSPAPRVVDRTATSATVEFTAGTVQSLFDDLYEAETVEAKVKSKWAGAKLKREEEREETVDGKPKKVKLFVYDQTRPTGPFLRQHLPAMEPDKDWHKLWRDMLWAIPRGNPTSREPFEQRAAVPKQPCKEGKSAWEALTKVAAARAKNGFHTGPVAGSLWLGAQATNAEAVPFEGRAEQTLLLHFWPLTAQVFVPAVLKVERGTDRLDVKTEFVGYVLAVPEVADLDQFLADYPTMLAGLGTAPRGYRPAAAVIDLPAEGALSFLAHLGTGKAAGSDVRYSLGSVEYLHQVKLGNNIKTQAAGRVAPNPRLLESYKWIVGEPGGKPRYGNPLFRRGLMQAALDGLPWYRPFGQLFAKWDAEVFVNSEESPRTQTLPGFWFDARKKFQEVIQAMPTEIDPKRLSDEELTDLLDRIVKRFLLAKAKKKQNVAPETKWAAMTDDQRKKVKGEKQKVALDAFYRARARHGDEFIAFFSEEIGSFGAPINPKSNDLQRFQTALLDKNRTDDIKTLTLTALSANF